MSRASYKNSFCTQWIVALVLFPLALIGALVVGISLLAREFDRDLVADHDLVLALVGLCVTTIVVIALLWVCGTIADSCLVHSRTVGSACGILFRRSDDVALSSEADVRRFAAACAGAHRGGAEFATPVGHGWSFFLNKTPVRGRRVFLHRLRGMNTARSPTHANGAIFYAGTTIEEILATLASEGRTIASTPSHGTITCGGWIGGSAHGSGGTQWVPTVGGGAVLDQATGRIVVHTDGKKLKDLIETARALSAPFAHQYVLLDVELLTVPDSLVQLDARRHVTRDDCHWWIESESRLRCTFVGKRGAMMLLWQDSQLDDETKKHIDPHCCSRECRYMQADLLSVLQGRVYPPTRKWFDWPVVSIEKWNGLQRLSNANQFSPLISALGMAIATFYHNVELILRVDSFNGEALHALQRALVVFHTAHGGRTEVRFGVSKDKYRGKLFLDASLPNITTALAAYGEVVATAVPRLPSLPYRHAVAFHPGKTQPDAHVFLAHAATLRVVAVRDL